MTTLLEAVQEAARLRAEAKNDPGPFIRMAYNLDYAALAAEMARLKDERDHAIECMETPPTKAELQRELVRLREDAERYRWIRDPCSGAERIFYCRGDYGKGLLSGPMLDAAIDRARKEGTP